MTDPPERVSTNDDVGPAPGDGVEAEDVAGNSLRGGGRGSSDEFQVRAHIHRPRVGPGQAAELGRVDLPLQLVRSPQVVVVQERDPSMDRLVRAVVA
jgi:hypothetical protein